MEDDMKWKLVCTGRVVEDIIYESISDFKSEHLIHSFTIDEEGALSSELYESLAKYYEKVSEKLVINIDYYVTANIICPDYSKLIYDNMNEIQVLSILKHKCKKWDEGDAIFRKSSGGIRLEFGGSEATSENDANLDKRKIEEMETVGYIHGGLVLMVMTLDLPVGYITRLIKSELYRIPEDIGSFGKAIELITAVWKSK
ncbi:5213_t:CDS:2, partial [Funneliformis caledonium]